jgi:hypothetical protein
MVEVAISRDQNSASRENLSSSGAQAARLPVNEARSANGAQAARLPVQGRLFAAEATRWLLKYQKI